MKYSKVKVLGSDGTLPTGKYKFEAGILVGKDAFTTLPGFLKKVEKQSQEEAKALYAQLGVAAAGLLLLGPLGLLAGFLVPSKDKVLVKLTLAGATADRIILAEVGSDVYAALLEIENQNNPES